MPQDKIHAESITDSNGSNNQKLLHDCHDQLHQKLLEKLISKGKNYIAWKIEKPYDSRQLNKK